MTKKLLVIIFIFCSISTSLLSIEPDVFVQSTVNRASKILGEDVSKDKKIEELKKIEPKLNNDVLQVFNLKNSINSKKSYGGTSFENIKKMIIKYKKGK